MKQTKLFPKLDEKSKEIKLMEKRRKEALERKKDYEKHMTMHYSKIQIPKNEYFTCPKCGLRMHWKVALGRRDGCPRCNIKFKKEDIIKTPNEIE